MMTLMSIQLGAVDTANVILRTGHLSQEIDVTVCTELSTASVKS